VSEGASSHHRRTSSAPLSSSDTELRHRIFFFSVLFPQHTYFSGRHNFIYYCRSSLSIRVSEIHRSKEITFEIHYLSCGPPILGRIKGFCWYSFHGYSPQHHPWSNVFLQSHPPRHHLHLLRSLPLPSRHRHLSIEDIQTREP